MQRTIHSLMHCDVIQRGAEGEANGILQGCAVAERRACAVSVPVPVQKVRLGHACQHHTWHNLHDRRMDIVIENWLCIP